MDRQLQRLGRPVAGWLEALARWVAAGAEQGGERLASQVGGAARRRAVALLSAVMALDAADKGAVGAVAAQLEPALHIGPVGLGLLVTASSLVGAVATVPVGSLTDRVPRVRLLALSIVVWGVAELTSGLAVSFLMLLLTRLALGAVTATAGPTVASLTGDLFPGAERSRTYSLIIAGELVGAGAGLLVAGLLAGWLGWRAAFFVLAVPGLALAWALYRHLPEPDRGGQSRIGVGDKEIVSAAESRHRRREATAGTRSMHAARGRRRPGESTARLRPAAEGAAAPGPIDARSLPSGDPRYWSLRKAVVYVLQVRTNAILILASALGYFFLAGLRTFAVVFARGQYGVGQAAATGLVVLVGVGALAGLLIAGRLTDRLLQRGRLDARIVVGAVSFAAAVVLLVPGLLSRSLAVAVPTFLVAAAFLAAPNPGLDAARLDVLPGRLWGRGEGVRTFLRQALEAFAPLLFGVVAAVFGGGRPSLGSVANGVHQVAGTTAETRGLDLAFLVMLVPLAMAGALLWTARRSYPADAAAATAMDQRLRRSPAVGDRAGARGP